MTIDRAPTQSGTVVLLGGEGIGPEVVDATALVLSALAPSLSFERPLHGEAAVEATGDPLPEATRELCRQADAVLFGATLHHSRPVLRFLRWGLETYANLRPTKSRPGLASPLKSRHPVDLLIVRENLEGEYPSREGEVEELSRRWPELRDKLGRPSAMRGSSPSGSSPRPELDAWPRSRSERRSSALGRAGSLRWRW